MFEEELVNAETVFGQDNYDKNKSMKKTVKDIKDRKVNGCVITMINSLMELGYQPQFKIVSFIIKAQKEDYEKAKQLQSAKGKKPYPSQTRVQASDQK